MRLTLGTIIVGVGLLALLRASSGRTVYIDASTGLPDVNPADAQPDDMIAEAPPAFDNVLMSTDPMDNIAAFLWTVRNAEHSRADVMAERDFSTFYGGSQFSDFSDHPVLTGEKKGVPLPPEWCIKAGFADGICVSTAAGALQINVPTWHEVREWGGPRLVDFSPASQLEAGRRILRKIGAASYIEVGDLSNGLRIASKRWASLPGSTAGQHVRSYEFIATAFNEGLGAQA